MRINQVIAGIAVVLVLGAGCADGEPENTADGTGAPTSASAEGAEPPSSPAPDDEMGTGDGADEGDSADGGPGNGDGSDESQHQGQEVPEGRVDGSALPDDYPQKVTTGADTTVTVTGRESGCGEASAEVQEQTAEQVSIVLVHTVSDDDRMCTMDIRYPPLTVQLDEPLGDRELVLTAEERQE